MLELLAPAGSMEALRAAVQNGANAVYLGCGSFNARQGAKNFTPQMLQEAVKYCHIRGVQVHLTLNTLVSDREMSEVSTLIRQAALCGVDAFIVQDLAVVQLCRAIAPEVSIHGSTQMTVHSLSGVLMCAAWGMDRVVLSRELGKEDIAYIVKNSPVEIEIFAHGALCMCYSGQCYLSSAIGGRSGNRGRCAQPCRQSYGYGRWENRYPLSLKDKCLLPHLAELERGACSEHYLCSACEDVERFCSLSFDMLMSDEVYSLLCATKQDVHDLLCLRGIKLQSKNVLYDVLIHVIKSSWTVE